ncbi:MAG TPA: ATP-dependent Clp protease proteolytic subunit, partial [Anaerolineaceae bacterium]|nr:ATP-dependent Clp protease proteolytic subunit [Anaerolineaceae bacterium]
MKTRWFLQVSLILSILVSFFQPLQLVSGQVDAPEAVVVQLKGPLTPVWSGYLQRGINRAVSTGAGLLIIELNTPGGSVDLMNHLVQQILASPVPVVVYVTPRGAMAASAGTLLVLSGHFAAMAPESTIGAASPVGMQGEDIGSTLEEKTKEILKASARSLAARRGADAVKLAEESIEKARAANSTEALQAGLIDFIARDVEDLLAQMDGSKVLMNGNEVVIRS